MSGDAAATLDESSTSSIGDDPPRGTNIVICASVANKKKSGTGYESCMRLYIKTTEINSLH